MTVREFGNKRRVTAPDIDDLLEEQEFSAGEVDIEAARISGGDHTGALAQGRICGSEITSVNFSESRVGPITLSDDTIRGVDFSNAEWLGVTARRVEILTCRAVGWRVTFDDLSDVYAEDCQFNYAVLRIDRARGVNAFKDCAFSRAMINGDLAGIVFRDCTFTDVEFNVTGAKGCDLIGSRFEGTTQGLMSLRGATFSAEQVAVLATQLAHEVGLAVQT